MFVFPYIGYCSQCKQCRSLRNLIFVFKKFHFGSYPGKMFGLELCVILDGSGWLRVCGSSILRAGMLDRVGLLGCPAQELGCGAIPTGIFPDFCASAANPSLAGLLAAPGAPSCAEPHLEQQFPCFPKPPGLPCSIPLLPCHPCSSPAPPASLEPLFENCCPQFQPRVTSGTAATSMGWRSPSHLSTFCSFSLSKGKMRAGNEK